METSNINSNLPINTSRVFSAQSRNSVAKVFPPVLFYSIQGEWAVKTNEANIVPLLTLLKHHTPTYYRQLRDITVVDHPERKLRFEVVYQLLSILYNQRLSVSVSVAEGTAVDSAVSIYPSAGWYERETWDRFGVFFRNHPDLRRRLTDYGFKGHPLRKDFPVTGFVEVRYNDFRKRILYEKVSLSQEYRQFHLDNSWNSTVYLINSPAKYILLFKSLFRLTVRTLPFHGEDAGSIPVRDSLLLKMTYSFFDFILYYTPLEQFDEVTWLTHRVIETVEPYVLFISEREFDVRERYTNPYSVSASSISFATFRQNESQIFVVLLIIGLLGHFAPSVAKQVFSFTEGFAHLFFLAFIHIFTGAFLSFWFTDFFFIVEEVLPTTNASVDFYGNGNLQVNYLLAPQFDFAFSIDEIRITLILGFFFIGGGEAEDEEDFLLADEGDLDVVEEVVAPLFVANLGKDVAENASLYLKVCSIFSFVLISNLRGRIPYGDTATSSLILTFWVALSVFASLVTLRIRKHGFNYFFSLFRPSGCPLPLIFLLIPIEFLSYSFRLVSLSVRLFANRRAGHTLRKVLIGFSYVRFTLGDGYAVAAFLPALVVFVLIFLERAVAGIQAYIFTILTCIYLKDLYVAH